MSVSTGTVWASIGACQVPPLAGSRGASADRSLKRALATGTPLVLIDHDARESGPRCEVDDSKSPSPLGIAQRPRPPATEAGESTQMSVMLTRRSPAGVRSTRATSSSE